MEIKKETIEGLVNAFKDGFRTVANSTAQLPSDEELYKAAEKVLKEEEETGKQRLSARGEFMCINEVDSFDVQATDCPLIPEDGIGTEGGKYFAEAPDAYTTEYAMQKCIESTYYVWFADKYFSKFCINK